jgi:hypothetical protein
VVFRNPCLRVLSRLQEHLEEHLGTVISARATHTPHALWLLLTAWPESFQPPICSISRFHQADIAHARDWPERESRALVLRGLVISHDYASSIVMAALVILARNLISLEPGAGDRALPLIPPPDRPGRFTAPAVSQQANCRNVSRRAARWHRGADRFRLRERFAKPRRSQIAEVI